MTDSNSVESFRTARTGDEDQIPSVTRSPTPPIPNSHSFVADVIHSLTSSRPPSQLPTRPASPQQYNEDGNPGIDLRTYAALTAPTPPALPGPSGSSTPTRTNFDITDSAVSLQKANRDVIGDLIHSLKIDASETDLKAMHRRTASAFSFEPLTPDEYELSCPASKSYRNSRHNFKSVHRPPTPPMLPSREEESDEEALQPPTPQYPPPLKLALILVSLYIAIFLVALDRTIIGPAIPAITNKFNSIDDIGWYGSAYMLTSCGFILLYGRVYTFYSTKAVFLSSILLFEIGSAVCGAATSSLILIIGRAVAGFGSSGIFTGAILIILEIVPLHRRPLLQGLFGACFGVASVAGPLLGGAFTGSKATWRWCFYLNLPLGAFTILTVAMFLKIEDKSKQKRIGTWADLVKKLDPLGTILFLPSITCLLLALEWGATEYSWGDPIIIALLTVFAVLFVAFVAWQAYTRNTTATVPARILFQRSVAFGGLSQFAVGATMLTVSMYIPLWFQAIQGLSAMASGIRTIPLVLSVVVGSIMSGALVQRIGYYTPFMIAGSILMSVGVGLLTTWSINITSAMWIGYQVILGLGVGFTMQHPNLAIQIVLPKPDIPTGTALLSLCQTLGGAVFVAVGQNTFIDKFVSRLHNIPGIDPEKAVSGGATSIVQSVPEALRSLVIEAYNASLTKGPFFACLIVACFTLPAALGMEWRSVKEGMQQKPPAPQDEENPASSGPEPEAPSHTAGEKVEGDQASVLEPPNRSARQGWRQSYRMVGDYSWVLIRRLNPDLKDELDRPRK